MCKFLLKIRQAQNKAKKKKKTEKDNSARQQFFSLNVFSCGYYNSHYEVDNECKSHSKFTKYDTRKSARSVQSISNTNNKEISWKCKNKVSSRFLEYWLTLNGSAMQILLYEIKNLIESIDITYLQKKLSDTFMIKYRFTLQFWPPHSTWISPLKLSCQYRFSVLFVWML